MIRVGVIGTGYMGENHVRIYSEMEDVKLFGISDPNVSRARELADRYETKPFADHRKMFEKLELDAVSIAAPTTLHYPIALDALRAGVDVLVEKPIADSIENAAAMIESAEETDRHLMVGHIERFNPAVLKLKEIIDSGALGKIVSISARRVGPYNPRIRDVGVILDIGVHDIDIISYLYGMKVNQVYAVAGSDIHSFEDHASIHLRLNHAYSGLVETNWLTPHKIRQLTAVGLKGVAYLDYLEQSVELHDDGWIRKARVEKSEPLKKELSHFIRCTRDGTCPKPSGEEGKHALEVAMAAIRSYTEERMVEI
ncbi:Gfo/Idh/MocA family oxidoreductase [Methanosarcina sp. KYL-1]|uniref:UDP-N-acetylglucosamine 3-dehydrogenase n=1 Tax=Methanosarcina sp. KYL-1 TaxID=2602068 RepID=UPI002101C1E5|nr:UDP-N-acetylglucosamine 3-dehydrogenase [Methanosarcina sp. KYL-1]MCQ1535112.1 Gfo/Idh/MocA family oxidoreductase [Methanosarcina sp. KYL-1]